MKDLFLYRFVYLELPAAAKTPCTRFRWWQPVFSGEDYDQWAVDDIIILSEKQKQVIPVVNPTLPQVCVMREQWIRQRMTDFARNLVSGRELGSVNLNSYVHIVTVPLCSKKVQSWAAHRWFRCEKDCEV